MEPLDALFWLAALFLVPQAVVLAVNLVAFPVLRPAERTPRAARVSILVPARDEAHNLATTLPLLLGQGAGEVIVLDDGSRDRTAALLAARAAADPRLRVIPGAPLPEGWTGKNWACHQLSQQARGELWAFTDADVRWAPGALDALLAWHAKTGAGLTTVWPRQITGSWFERLVVPVVDVVLLAGLPHPAVARVPAASVAAGNGQLMMFTPDAYRRAGGHAAVRGEVLDDVRLAQRAKAASVSLALALGGDLLATRMYADRDGVIDGFAKNILSAVAGSMPLLWGLVLINTLAYALVWPLALLEPRWLALGALGLSLRAGAAAKTGRSPLEVPLQPLFPWGLWAIAARVAARRGSYRWKGRTYRAADRRSARRGATPKGRR